MRLPDFLRAEGEPASAADVAGAFALTGFFLVRYAFAPRGLPVPDARGRFVAAVLMNKKAMPPDPGYVQDVALREAPGERYLAYALSTIMQRALPDARDGL